MAGAALLAVLVAGVALALSGMSTESIVGLLTALVAVAGGMVGVYNQMTEVKRINADQDEKIAVITEQTNGVLAGKIKAAVTEALREAMNGPTVNISTLSSGRTDNSE